MKCIECGHELTQEEIDVNMCWTCGHIIDESLVDDDSKDIIMEHNTKLKNQSFVEIEEDLFSTEYKEIYNRFLMTTGFGFEGYEIKSYKGIVHAECSLGTGFISELSLSINDLVGGSSKRYENKLGQAKEYVEEILKRNAILKGCNAIIGVDFDILSLANNMIVVSANATAVWIEKK